MSLGLDQFEIQGISWTELGMLHQCKRIPLRRTLSHRAESGRYIDNEILSGRFLTVPPRGLTAVHDSHRAHVFLAALTPKGRVIARQHQLLKGLVRATFSPYPFTLVCRR